MPFKVYENGELVPQEIMLQAALSKSVGVFETMRLYSGIIFKQEDHLQRLTESIKTSGYPFKISMASLKQSMKKAIRSSKVEEGIVRLTLVGGREFVFIKKRSFKSSPLKGIVLRTSPLRRVASNSWAPETKTGAYQNGALASLEPSGNREGEWVFLNNEGYVTETRIGNIFLVKCEGGQKRLITPPLQGILNGVTRQFVIECAASKGFLVKEAAFTRHEMFNADEVFLTNTSWEVLPVRELDGRTLETGSLTTSIHREFQKGVKKYVEASKRS